MFAFHRRPSQLDHEAAREYTQVERVYSDHDAIERTDGALIGVIEVLPPSMALATDTEWETKADSFQDFLNTVVEFPIQIFSTTQAFPADDYLAHYEERLTDPDVSANPRLGMLIQEYVEWYRQDIEARHMTIREHYVIVPVTPAEIRFEHESLVAKLARLPLCGVLLGLVFAPPVAQERAALLDALDVRLDRVETGLRDIESCRAHRLSATDATSLIGDFWAGDQQEYGDLSQKLRDRPLVGGTE
jgi:hypothetical protein